MVKKNHKILTPPPIVSTLAFDQIVGFLKGQKFRGEELLKKDFLSLEDIQLWNSTTKDILTKAFGPVTDYIDSILYAGDHRVFSMYEPESILEKHRRKNFQTALKLLKNCIDQLGLGKEHPKKDAGKKMEGKEASESPKVSLVLDLDEEEKELEPDEERLETDETERIEGLEEPEKEVSVAASQDKVKKEVDLKRELSKPDVSKGVESVKTTGRGKGFITLDSEEEKKKLEVRTELSKPDTNKRMETMETLGRGKVFVVHGQDEEKKEAVVKLLTKLDLEPVILHEQPGQGMTLIEKFEQYLDVGFAVIVLTGDDYGYPKGKPEESKPRPRQNVVFELGFLMGRFKRNCVCALHEEGLELPSDYQGAVFIPYDAASLWKLLMARAMKVANVPIDLNKAV